MKYGTAISKKATKWSPQIGKHSFLSGLSNRTKMEFLLCSQHVERLVALTSKAAEYTIGYQNRHQWILNKINATKKIPTSSTKEDYINLVKNQNIEKVKKKLCTESSE